MAKSKSRPPKPRKSAEEVPMGQSSNQDTQLFAAEMRVDFTPASPLTPGSLGERAQSLEEHLPALAESTTPTTPIPPAPVLTLKNRRLEFVRMMEEMGKHRA